VVIATAMIMMPSSSSAPSVRFQHVHRIKLGHGPVWLLNKFKINDRRNAPLRCDVYTQWEVRASANEHCGEEALRGGKVAN